MPDESYSEQIGQLIDTIVENLEAVRRHGPPQEQEPYPDPWMVHFCDACEELIDLVGVGVLPRYFPGMIESIRRTGFHEFFPTHVKRSGVNIEVYCGRRIPVVEVSEPPIFEDLARLRYTLPELLAERDATAATQLHERIATPPSTATLEPAQLTNETTSDANDGVAKSHKTKQEVAERLELLRSQGERFTSQAALADQFGCSVSTVNAAIHSLPKLMKWAGWDTKKPTAARAVVYSDIMADRAQQSTEADPSDLLTDDEVDTAMAAMLNVANHEKRAELNDLDNNGRRRFAEAYTAQKCDEAQPQEHVR